MSSDSSGCKVIISGIRGQSQDTIVLFFESSRFCPKGGTVNHFVQISEDKAVVIFKDSQVADRLDERLSLPDGTQVSVEPYKNQRGDTSPTAANKHHVSPESNNYSINDRSGNKNRSSNLDKSQIWNHPSIFGSHGDSSTRMKGSVNCSAQCKGNIRLKETKLGSTGDGITRNKAQERLLNSESSCSSEPETRSRWKDRGSRSRSSDRSSSDSSSRERSRTESKSHGGNVRGKHGGRRKERSGSKERSVAVSTSHDGKTSGKHGERRQSRSSSGSSNEIQTRRSKAQNTNTNNDTSKASFKHSNTPKINSTPEANPTITRSVERFQFSSEKLKLMKLVWELDSLSTTCNCSVKFDELNHTVAVEGANSDIQAVKLRLYEMAINFETQRVNIFPQIQDLLTSARGEAWLTEEFCKRRIAALVYIKDGSASLIARNKDTLSSADNLIKQFVSKQSISFDDCHKSFLQSPPWSQKVQAIETSALLSVHTDYSGKKIEIAGHASDVALYANEIRELLRTNRTKTTTLRYKIGVVRMLQKQESSINKDIQQVVSSPIQLEFGCQEGNVKVIGLMDEVSVAEDIICYFTKTIHYGTHEICTPGLTKEMFRAKHSKQRDVIELLENRHNCVIEVRGGNNRSSQGRAGSPSAGIEVTLGNIVQFEADVLVNTIADEDLARGGVVLKQFLEAGTPKLQQDLQQAGIPQVFGNDVIATDAHGKLKSKFIFHAAIRKYQNQDSIEKLHNMIKKCLEMAASQKVSTIAFPTLGGGRLAFNPTDVVECFVRAKQSAQTNIKIFIVAVDDHMHGVFKSCLANALSETFESEARDCQRSDIRPTGGLFKDLICGRKSQEKPSSDSESCSSTPFKNVIVFHINTLNEKDLQIVKQSLMVRIMDMIDESTIKDDVITVLADDDISSIRSLQTPDIAIGIDRKNGIIKVKGERLKVQEIKILISTVIASLRDMDRYPRYWNNYKFTDAPASKVGIKRVRINPSSSWHAEVSHMVMASWSQKKVGLGRDAAGLGPHAIKIRNIYCIENPMLMEKYMGKRKQLSKEASLKKFSPVGGLENEQEILTMELGLRHLYSTLNRNVNEYFLLHGTKKETVDLINGDGLDTRICGDETLFGVGSYFAESSTKADQYTDPVDNRVALGQPLYMYVCRVLLGKPYICDDPKNVEGFKRPPCVQGDCHKDKCAHPPVGRFDSIIGTHRPNPLQNGRLHFREFVVFHPEQSYPDFLVEYERVKYP